MLDTPQRHAPDESATAQSVGRHDRPTFIAFVTDAGSERALHDGLAEVAPGGVDVRRGGIRAAIASMEKGTTPRVLVVDISDEDQPLTALAQLANVVEPDVNVLVVGDLDSIDFYREVTRSLGAHDYVTKPLTKDKIGRHLGSLFIGSSAVTVDVQGGGLVIISGVRGGVGATTLAVNLAGHFGVVMRRHTVLLDPDLHLGDAAFLLNIKPGSGLRMALEAPDRIDALLAERAAQPAAERLHVLAGDELMSTRPDYAVDSAIILMAALRRRYNFIVADVACRPARLHDELLRETHQRVLVMTPTLTSVRSTLRQLTQSNATSQSKRPVIVLNRLGCPGSLTRRQVEDALAIKIDIAIPDQPKQVAEAAMTGELVASSRNGFRGGVEELARRVAFIGLLDSTSGAARVSGQTRDSKRWGMFRRKP